MRRSAALAAGLVGMGRPVLVSSARGLRTTRARTDLQLDSAPGGEVLFGLAQILIEARDGFEVRPDSRWGGLALGGGLRDARARPLRGLPRCIRCLLSFIPSTMPTGSLLVSSPVGDLLTNGCALSRRLVRAS